MKILASPAFNNRRTNPYNAALYTAIRQLGATVGEFTKQRLLFGRWDVVHVHWPDGALNTRHAAVAAVRLLYLVGKLLFAKARGAKIVWTVHNLQAHHPAFPRLERWLWRAFVPLVDGAISLSRSGLALARARFPALAGKAQFVIPHGHYRGCYKNGCSRAEARDRFGLEPARPVVAFVGQIKPYKNVPTLLRAFLDCRADDPGASLLITGKLADPAVAAGLAAHADQPTNVVCRFGHIADDDMQFALNACDLAVFPYREILNSGSAILALSFDRPVLVPAKGAMGELRELIGANWVMTYEGELTGDVLRAALRWATETPRPAPCDLAPLAWETIAEQTLAAYRAVTAQGSVLACPHPAEA